MIAISLSFASLIMIIVVANGKFGHLSSGTPFDLSIFSFILHVITKDITRRLYQGQCITLNHYNIATQVHFM